MGTYLNPVLPRAQHLPAPEPLGTLGPNGRVSTPGRDTRPCLQICSCVITKGCMAAEESCRPAQEGREGESPQDWPPEGLGGAEPGP